MNEEFRKIIEEAKRLRYPYNHLRILAYIATRILGDASEIKILRGMAAAYYTNGYCTTFEVDIYSPKLYNNPGILQMLGFRQHKEYLRSPWILEETDTVIDFVGLDIPFDFILVEIDGDGVEVLSLEDTLAYYLSEIIHWMPSKEAVQRVNMIYIAHQNRIRKDFLEKSLSKMNAYDSLKRVSPTKFSDKLSSKLIQFLEEIIKEG